MRFVEIALLALPMVAYFVWRRRWPDRAPSRALAMAVLGAVLLLGAFLLISRWQDAVPGNASYVPARIEHGQVTPGHAAPSTP